MGRASIRRWVRRVEVGVAYCGERPTPELIRADAIQMRAEFREAAELAAAASRTHTSDGSA